MKGILSLAIIYSAIRLATPLLLAALGGLFSERSGVINIALEGLMLFGAFFAAAVTLSTQSAWMGMGAGAIAGALLALLYGLFVIRLSADQIVAVLAQPHRIRHDHHGEEAD